MSDILEIKYAGLRLPLSLFTRIVLPTLLKPLPLLAPCQPVYAGQRHVEAPPGGQTTVIEFLEF